MVSVFEQKNKERGKMFKWADLLFYCSIVLLFYCWLVTATEGWWLDT
jgi:hypothetical protein